MWAVAFATHIVCGIPEFELEKLPVVKTGKQRVWLHRPERTHGLVHDVDISLCSLNLNHLTEFLVSLTGIVTRPLPAKRYNGHFLYKRASSSSERANIKASESNPY